MKKLIVIDMDHTILDTVGLKEGLGVVLNNNPNMSATEIVKYFNDGDERIEEYIKNNVNNFLFDGVDEKLKELNKNAKVILLTYGLVSFQLLKTKVLPVEYFDDIILTEDDKLKVKVMREVHEKYNDYEIHFINDNWRQNEAIKKELDGKIIVKDVDNYGEKKGNDIGNILGQIILDFHNLKKKIKEKNVKD